MLKYILDENGEPVVEPDLIRWAMWLETENREVARDQIFPVVLGQPSVLVSTVFLGIDHNWMGGTPVLWETMCFIHGGGPHDEEGDYPDGGDPYRTIRDYQTRYTSREDALVGHRRAIRVVNSVLRKRAAV